MLALSLTAALAGLMYARNPDWSYAVTIEALAYADRRTVTSSLVAALALFAGAAAGTPTRRIEHEVGTSRHGRVMRTL